jgi:exopolysaccharide biosynthesis polyprenyl glycosylphosphotransferase
MTVKILTDAVLINLSFIFAYYFRFKVLLFVTPSSIPLIERYSNTMVFITLIWLAVFKLIGMYDEKKFTALIDELAMLVWGISLSSFILLGMLFLYRELWFSRLVLANAWLIALILLAAYRLLLLLFLRLLHLSGRGVHNTLILGAGEMGETLARKMGRDRGLGYQVVGFLDDDQTKIGQMFCGIKVLGSLDRVKEVIVELKVSEVIFASNRIPADKVLDIITECERFGIEFKLVPGILELIASRLDIDELAGVPLLTVTEIRLKGLNAFIKRLADMVISLAGIVLISPLLALFALLVKVTSPGPVFFIQERIGLDGNIFPMFKFRSMVKDADAQIGQLEGRSEVEGHLFKIKDDPRITPLGKFMRRCSIDELPQLFNVFLGHMSLVGPRPPLPREVVKYNSWHRKRLRVRPGITGPWQVSGRSTLPFDDMVRLDIYYIENWSLWLDCKIMLRTLPVVVSGSGAY